MMDMQSDHRHTACMKYHKTTAYIEKEATEQKMKEYGMDQATLIRYAILMLPSRDD